MATLPVVFAELARKYSMKRVNDPTFPDAAANGQYILIRRKTYDGVGGHAAIATDILEDVALARAVKSSGYNIFFRYAGDRVRTRMYRNYTQLREGWTKNLALLFPNTGWLAAKTLVLWSIPWAILFTGGMAKRAWYLWCSAATVGALLTLTLRLRSRIYCCDPKSHTPTARWPGKVEPMARLTA